MDNYRRRNPGIAIWIMLLVCALVFFIASERLQLMQQSGYTYTDFQKDIQENSGAISEVPYQYCSA